MTSTALETTVYYLRIVMRARLSKSANWQIGVINGILLFLRILNFNLSKSLISIFNILYLGDFCKSFAIIQQHERVGQQ